MASFPAQPAGKHTATVTRTGSGRSSSNAHHVKPGIQIGDKQTAATVSETRATMYKSAARHRFPSTPNWRIHTPRTSVSVANITGPSKKSHQDHLPPQYKLQYGQNGRGPKGQLVGLGCRAKTAAGQSGSTANTHVNRAFVFMPNTPGSGCSLARRSMRHSSIVLLWTRPL